MCHLGGRVKAATYLVRTIRPFDVLNDGHEGPTGSRSPTPDVPTTVHGGTRSNVDSERPTHAKKPTSATTGKVVVARIADNEVET